MTVNEYTELNNDLYTYLSPCLQFSLEIITDDSSDQTNTIRMVSMKQILKLKIQMILHSSGRDRSAATLLTKIEESNYIFGEEPRLKSNNKNSIFFTCGMFDIRNSRIYQVNLWVFPSISLGRSFEETVRRHCLALCGEMRNEIRRLMSFANITVDASIIRLASAGFFATGVGDGTMCFSCGIMYNGWQGTNDPAKVHRDISPNCSHAAGHDDRNVPVIPFSLPAPTVTPRTRNNSDLRTTTDATEVHAARSSEVNERASDVRPEVMPDNRENRRMWRERRIRQVVGDIQSSPDTNNEYLPWETSSGTTDFQLRDSPENPLKNNKQDIDSSQRLLQNHYEKSEDSASSKTLCTAGPRDNAQSIQGEKEYNTSDTQLFRRILNDSQHRIRERTVISELPRAGKTTERQMTGDEKEGAAVDETKTESVYPGLSTMVPARALEEEKSGVMFKAGGEFLEAALIPDRPTLNSVISVCDNKNIDNVSTVYTIHAARFLWQW